mgnify:CR=1 FL=1
MENWGLVTYRETALLVSNASSLLDRRYVSLVVAHELAHQASRPAVPSSAAAALAAAAAAPAAAAALAAALAAATLRLLPQLPELQPPVLLSAAQTQRS